MTTPRHGLGEVVQGNAPFDESRKRSGFRADGRPESPTSRGSKSPGIEIGIRARQFANRRGKRTGENENTARFPQFRKGFRFQELEKCREGVKLASLSLSGKYSTVAHVGNHGYDSRCSR